MKGFDAEFRDLPHYIYAITERIWEGRRVGAIRTYYSADCPVRSADGLVVGSEAVVAATLATLAEFPDRRLLGEEVVWSGNEEHGFLSSHRIFSTATHLGDGAYGAATHRPVRYRVIADCLVKENRVREEWLVRDQGAIARCLGLSARTLAQRQMENGAGAFFTPDGDVPTQYAPQMDADADAGAYRRLWEDLWNLTEVAACRRMYHPAATLAGPGGVERAGHDEIEHFHIGYLGALSQPRFQVHDLSACENEHGKTVAMRWSVSGLHSGRGAFAGRTHNAPLYVMGISHARMAAGKIIAEWILTDEVAVWKQILSAEAAACR